MLRSGDVKSLPPREVKPPPSHEPSTEGEEPATASGGDSPITRGETNQIFAMTDYALLAAIAAGWTTLEAALRSAAGRSGIHLKPPDQTPIVTADRLIREGRRPQEGTAAVPLSRRTRQPRAIDRAQGPTVWPPALLASYGLAGCAAWTSGQPVLGPSVPASCASGLAPAATRTRSN